MTVGVVLFLSRRINHPFVVTADRFFDEYEA